MKLHEKQYQFHEENLVGSATVPTIFRGARQSESGGHSDPPYERCSNRLRPRNRKRYNDVEDEDEDEYEPKDELNSHLEPRNQRPVTRDQQPETSDQ
jgi:hypothetical protein